MVILLTISLRPPLGVCDFCFLFPNRLIRWPIKFTIVGSMLCSSPKLHSTPSDVRCIQGRVLNFGNSVKRSKFVANVRTDAERKTFLFFSFSFFKTVGELWKQLPLVQLLITDLSNERILNKKLERTGVIWGWNLVLLRCTVASAMVLGKIGSHAIRKHCIFQTCSPPVKPLKPCNWFLSS